MSKKLEIYEKALETIRADSLLDAQAIAAKALEDGEFDSEDRGVLIAKIADVVVTAGVMFGSAEEIADAVNQAGLMTSRGKVWTKSSITRYMGDVRAILQQKLMAAVGAVNVATPVEPAPEPVSEPELDAATEEFLKELSVDPEIAELEELTRDL